MRREFQIKMPEVADKISFYIGDVRDIYSVKNAMHSVNYIFHAAAPKQVSFCEYKRGTSLPGGLHPHKHGAAGGPGQGLFYPGGH